MPSPLFGITADTARIGMDALALRQMVAAQNIAQRGVPGARPLQVSFAAQMEAAARTAQRDPQWVRQLDEAVAAAQPLPAPQPRGLDADVVELNEVSLHYHSLARALRLHFSMLSMAMQKGRGA